MKITIDIKDVADRMVSECEIEPQMIRDGDFDGWSESLLDSLEKLYDLETLVIKEITCRNMRHPTINNKQ